MNAFLIFHPPHSGSSNSTPPPQCKWTSPGSAYQCCAANLLKRDWMQSRKWLSPSWWGQCRSLGLDRRRRKQRRSMKRGKGGGGRGKAWEDCKRFVGEGATGAVYEIVRGRRAVSANGTGQYSLQGVSRSRAVVAWRAGLTGVLDRCATGGVTVSSGWAVHEAVRRVKC